MNNLTKFYGDLFNDAEKLARFNAGSCEAEVLSNRKAMLKAAGVKHAGELIEMKAQDLPNFLMRQLGLADFELETTICRLIVDQSLEYPERIAIIDGDIEISYEALWKKANEIAGELKYSQIPPGSLVGVCMNRSWELVATLLGVMQAGCTYVPLDPAYPKDRVKYMLAHSRAAAAIVDDNRSAELCEGVNKLIWVDQVGKHADQSIQPSPNDLAYVIYTSGSTGKPKGVAVEHKNVVAMHQEMKGRFSVEELKGVFAGASVCFDTSVMEIMGTLSLGGTIILGKNGLELTKLPASNKIKTCVMVASAVQALLTTERLPDGIQCLVFGGEALKRSLVDEVYNQNPKLRVLNAYGPTEDTVYSTISEVPRGEKMVTIGKSVPNSRAYILDSTLQPVAEGEFGELYLAGSKLARGYLYDEELTKDRFIEKEPCDRIPDTRLYKTGDLCKWATNGEIEFLGRIDQQVKVRGFRIELGEIESTLESMNGVDAVGATTIDGGTGQKILAVYVVRSNDEVTESKVKSYLSEKLPKYMVPQVVKYLKELPLLPNDKLDRNKLGNLEKEAQSKSEPLKPQGRASGTGQHLIISIIQNEVAALLNLSDPTQVQPEDSFQDLGIDSLTSLELSSRLTNMLGRKVSAEAILQYTTPNALVSYIEQMGNGNNNSLSDKPEVVATNSLANFQTHIQSSHPTFQAAKAPAWNATDKSKLVQEVLRMVNNDRRNPYSKVLRTGSATSGIVGDAYNDEEQQAIIWTTNLYLGLNRNSQVMEQASTALSRFGTGMGTSAAASGMTNQHLEFEAEFADLVGKPSACLFPTGYTANVGAVAGLLGKNDVVVIDQLCHASIVDGARLCGATIRTFQHNNVADLEAVLESEVSPYRTVLVVLEGVYSMGEGAAPVAEIVHKAKEYNALVLVDEAHSFGFYGEGGAGICAAQGVTDQVDFIMTTLSKALGSLGGVVAASQEHVDLLKSSSRAYIFQASVSPADMAAALTSLRLLRSDDSLRERLWDTTRYMRQQFENAGYDLGTGDGPIVTPHFSDKDKLYAIVQNLYQKGVQTSAVTYPIVESGRGRLRLICSAAHTRKDVDKTLEALVQAEREVDQQLITISNEAAKDSNLSVSEIEDWAGDFLTFLKKSITTSSTVTPNLAIMVGASEESETLTFLVKDGDVTLHTNKIDDVPTCSLFLADKSALMALQSFDVQGLLYGVCNGKCKLDGHVEPFIWLIARIVDYQEYNVTIDENAEPQLTV